MTRYFPIRSEPKLSSILILLVGGIGGLLRGYHFLSQALVPEYPQLFELVVGAASGGTGAAALLALLFYEKLELDTEKLGVRSIFNTTKKTIYIKDIVRYSESVTRNRAGQAESLTVFIKR